MKPALLLAALFVLSSSAFAARHPSSAKGCSANALDAAEEEYGNDMDGTHITPRPDNYFVVTVGIGNPEDGAHTYLVKCPSKAPLCDCAVEKEIDPAKKKKK